MAFIASSSTEGSSLIDAVNIDIPMELPQFNWEVADSIDLARERLGAQVAEEAEEEDSSSSCTLGSDSSWSLSIMETDDGITDFIVPEEPVPLPDTFPIPEAVVPEVNEAPEPVVAPQVPWINNALYGYSSINAIMGWGSVETPREDPLVKHVQKIYKAGDRMYSIECIRTVLHVGEQSIIDMFGEFVVHYLQVVGTDAPLAADRALRIGIPDILRAAELKRKRKKAEKRMLTRFESEKIVSIMYSEGMYWGVLGTDDVFEQIILASVVRGNNLIEQIQFIIAVDMWCCDHPNFPMPIA